MATVLAAAFIALLLAVLVLHLLSLPANWILLGLVAVWKWTHPAMDAGWWFFGLLAGLALAGEIIEQVVQIVGGKRYGSSGRGLLGAFIGGFAGAIMGAPILFGLGAIPGALLGAYAGGLIFELMHERPFVEAHRSALGNMYGRILGNVLKLALGITMLVLSIPRIWPN
ncbi:DUF456 domain-containing protein [Desulfocurvibacter africanus]|uniref:DUF456 domain-containing protein n=1 Tax=Desulfocurvibacter africanus subsp. africanus str. Walvis Bay TaxID=690850 RepID=F3Z3G4_DESAF|nr:DUF456 domain-containing protein [Desulfocurvibacter africanus]EGJ51504.1 protein of unknown function DUF456 [Desulfocurvibacter africanus subsp. africanus str. Walvis Bay]